MRHFVLRNRQMLAAMQGIRLSGRQGPFALHCVVERDGCQEFEPLQRELVAYLAPIVMTHDGGLAPGKHMTAPARFTTAHAKALPRGAVVNGITEWSY
jgi:hypothetical protein